MIDLVRKKSDEIWQEMKKVIPGGVNSPVRSCHAVKTHPLIAASGERASIIDVDGKRYIDFCMSWGALLHGHAHPKIVEAAYNALLLGTTYGTSCEAEHLLATSISQKMPAVEMVRSVSSGTEATMSAVRLARAYTHRKDILKFHGNYHGHADQFLIQAGSGAYSLHKPSSDGIPPAFLQHTKTLPYNDVDSLYDFLFTQKRGFDLASIILEPITANMGVVAMLPEIYELLEEGRKKFGYLLIFDEVVTGFRVGIGGAQSLYHVIPDLTCLGKIIGGGFPAAAFGGKKEIMSLLAPLGNVYQAGTLSGNPVAMRAGLEALRIVEESKDFYIELRKKAEFFINPIIDYIQKKGLCVALQSVGSMWTLFFGVSSITTSDDLTKLNSEMFSRYFLFMLKNGVYIPPLHHEAWFISSAHSVEEITYAAECTLLFFEQYKDELVCNYDR